MWLLILLVRGYRLLLSPWLGHSCRFQPTCSAYRRGGDTAISHRGANAWWSTLMPRRDRRTARPSKTGEFFLTFNVSSTI
ncbi:MAG: membrane protein insertion efficiency factor YidD [Litoreibacter sp.]